MDSNKKTGRKTKLTPELIQRICDFIHKGNYVSTACRAVGIHTSTYFNWVKRGEADTEADIDSVYTLFMQALLKAEAEAEVELVKIVNDAAPKNWIAAMTLLERRHPEKWGRKDRSTINVGHKVQFNVVHCKKRQVIESEAYELPEGKNKRDTEETHLAE